MEGLVTYIKVYKRGKEKERGGEKMARMGRASNILSRCTRKGKKEEIQIDDQKKKRKRGVFTIEEVKALE